MSNKQNTTDGDLVLLHGLLVNEPEGLAALRRMDEQRTQLALALNAHVIFQGVAEKLNATQLKVTLQVLKVARGPALQVAGEIAERVLRERMRAAQLDPDSDTDRKKFARQLGNSIVVSPA